MSPVGLPYGYIDFPTVEGFGVPGPTGSNPPIIFTPPPVILPPAGTYPAAQVVTISCPDPNATISYAIDAEEPITNWTPYTGALTVNASQTVSAMAVDPPNLPSVVVSNAYTIEVPAAMPLFQPGSGTYPGTQLVAITCATPNATIYYTTNNTTPTTSSAIYSTPIPVSVSSTLQALATAPGFLTSPVAIDAYIIMTQCATPVFAPIGGNYTSAQTVTMTCATAASSVYYTTDGTTPVPGQGTTQLYTVPIVTTGSGTEQIQAIGVAAMYLNSNVEIQTYLITAALLPSISVGTGPLSNRFVDQNGNVKFLKGLDLPGLEASCAQGNQPWYGSPPNWAQIAADEVNYVRIPLNTASILSAAYGHTFYVLSATATQTTNATVTTWASGPTSADPFGNYIAAMDAAAVAAASYGITIEWDFHWSFPSFTLNLNGVPTAGAAMPLWQAPYSNSSTDLLALQWLINRYGTQNTNPPPGVNTGLIIINPYNEPYIDYGTLSTSVYNLMLTGGPVASWTSYNLVGATITVNQAWATVGNTALLQAIRAPGAKNPTGFSGPGYAHSMQNPASWIPEDSISPPQIFAEQHLYPAYPYPYTGGTTTSPTLSSTSNNDGPAQGAPYTRTINITAAQAIPAGHTLVAFTTMACDGAAITAQTFNDNAGNAYTNPQSIPGSQGNLNLSQGTFMFASQSIPNAITTTANAWTETFVGGDADYISGHVLDFATGTIVGSSSAANTAGAGSSLATTAELLAYVNSVTASGKILVGQWADYQVVGEMNQINAITPGQPAIMGLGFANFSNANTNQTTLANNWLAGGGILAGVVAPSNPTLGGNFFSGGAAGILGPNNGSAVNLWNIVQSGTAENTWYLAGLTTLAANFAKVNGPIICRLYHEFNYFQFWWGPAPIVISGASGPCIVTMNNGFVAGDSVIFVGQPPVGSGGGSVLPAPLISGTVYYVSSSGLSGSSFKIAATQAHAIAGTNSIAITSAASGQLAIASPSQFIALWIFTVTQLRGMGVKNVLYTFCIGGNPDYLKPNVTSFLNNFYPGNNYVDVVSIDWYDDTADYSAQVTALAALGPPVYYAEVGPSQAQADNTGDYSTLFAKILSDGQPVFGAVPWSQTYAIPNQQLTPGSMTTLMKNPNVVTLADLPGGGGTAPGNNNIPITVSVSQGCDIYAMFFNQSWGGTNDLSGAGAKCPTIGSLSAAQGATTVGTFWNFNKSPVVNQVLLIKQTVTAAGTYTLYANNADVAPDTEDWFHRIAFGIAGTTGTPGGVWPQVYPDQTTPSSAWSTYGLDIINTTKIPLLVGETGGTYGPVATVGEPFVNYLWGFAEANNYAGVASWQGSQNPPTSSGTNYVFSNAAAGVATIGQGVATLQQIAGNPIAAATPTFLPAAPYSFTGTVSVAISCSTPPAPSAIYYTTDGSAPTYPISGTTQTYEGPVLLTASTTLKAIATAIGYTRSLTASGQYTLSSGSGVQAPANLYITLMGQSSAGQSTGTTFLAANYAPKANQLSLAWAPGSGGVAPYRYNIQRTAANSATFTPLVSGVNALGYTDLTANQNTGVVLATVGVQGEQTFPANGYLYQVQTQDSTGATSAWSPSQSAVIYANGNNTGIAGDFQGTGSAYFVVTYNKANASVPVSAGGPFPNNTNGGTTHSNCIYLQAPPGAAGPLWLPFWGNMFCYWNAWSSWANYLTFDFYSSSGLPFTLQLAYRVTNPSGNGGDQFITVSGGANRTTILNPPAGVWTRYKLQLHTASHGGLLDDYGPNGSGPAITQYAMYKIVLQINSAVGGQGYGVDNLMLTQI